MTTPAFVPTSPSTLTQIRYHTALDPYHYTIDNRPLSDIATNLQELGVGGIDAARRAGLINNIATNLALESLFHIEDTAQFHGLVPNYNLGALTLGRGALTTVTLPYVGYTQPVLRQGVLLVSPSFAIAPAASAGQSVDYLVQVKINDMATGTASSVPYFDILNAYIPSSTTVGELGIGIKTGVAAATGSQVTPTPDAGYTSLYKVTFTNGQLVPTIETVYNGATPVSRFKYLVTYADNSSGSAASFTGLNGMTIPRFENGVSSSISFAVPIKGLGICPSAPIRLRLLMSSTTAGGNSEFQLDTLSIKVGASVATTPVPSTEVFAMNATANIASSFSTSPTFSSTSIKVPPSLFSEFSGGVWKITSDVIVFQLTRLGSSISDTNSGSVDLLSLEVIQ